MREDLVEILKCPETGAPLELVWVGEWFELESDPEGARHVVDGLLLARGGVPYCYPILDEIPRLVPRRFLNDEEKAYLEEKGQPEGPAEWAAERKIEPEIVTQEDLEADIRARMELQYQLTESSPAQSRQRCEGEIRYMSAEARGTNKLKYVRLLEPYLGKVGTLLETGGNFPGLTRNLAERYEPRRAVVANIQILFPKAFKTADRSIAAVRADVQALPFQDRSFELVVSGFMLEHVPDWRAGLRCMMDAGERVFLAFGPNKWFPFEVGHIDAPLAGTLPSPLNAWVAWAWLAAIGRHRPLHRVKAILGEVFHVGSRAFEKEARRLGGKTRNLFPELVGIIIGDQKAPRTGPRKLLKTYPRLGTLAARALTTLGMEPQIYYLVDGRNRESRSARIR
jgi:uncharacterized protein YbaR (Trm112 family)